MPLPSCGTSFGDCDFKQLSLEQIIRMYLIVDDGSGCPTLKTSATVTSGSGEDFELRRSTYKANTAGTGYSIGDYIQRVDIINVTTPGVVSSLWFNETTGLTIGAAPTQAHIDPFNEPVSIGDGGNVALGATADAVATTDTGTFSLIALTKRLLQKSTTLQVLFPATLGQKADAASLAVTLSTEGTAQLGSLTETAPASDTASSGINGRLQRIAQRLTSLLVLPSTLGQKTMANSLAITIASDQSSLPINGNTGGYSEKLSNSVTTSATAYTINDNIGGIQTLVNLLRTSGGTGVLQGLNFWALANQKPNLIVDFFDASPGTGTYTNDAAQVIAGDHAAWLGSVEISISDWKDTGVISRCTKTGLGIILKGNASRNIYMTIQDKTGVTFGSTAGLFFKTGILQD